MGTRVLHNVAYHKDTLAWTEVKLHTPDDHIDKHAKLAVHA